MFNLRAEMERNQKQIPSSKLATVVTSQKIQGFVSDDSLATSNDSHANEKTRLNSVAICSHESPAIKLTESQTNQSLSPLSPASSPLELNFNFLNETPFTKGMIIEGLRLWNQPFSQQDLDDITAGELTIEQARKYLFLWARQNLSRYLKLKRNS